METCSIDHPAIAYTDFSCPLCSALEDIVDLDAKIDKLQTEVYDLTDKYETLSSLAAEIAPEILLWT